MSKNSFTEGSSEISQFFWWINERTSIWYKRFVLKQSAPWTDDHILQSYKFTNAFRQLDRGTIALREKILERAIFEEADPELIVFNIMWYRLFNLDVHAEECGWCADYEQLKDYISKRAILGKKIFTSAHMTTGCAGEDKYVSYLRAAKEAFDEAAIVVKSCVDVGTMHSAFKTLLQFYMVGPFVAYEMACDLRFTPLLDKAPDKLTWANVGPGAKRGMLRLGLEPTVESMVRLYYIGLDVRAEIAGEGNIFVCSSALSNLVKSVHLVGWPFELREIEHSLCEFDKYERARLDEGRPRQKYNGKGSTEHESTKDK